MDANFYSRDLNKCCRTCMSDKSEDMYDIFSVGKEFDIAVMISLYTSIKVEIDDIFPKKLCTNCYTCLITFHQFRKTAETVEVELQEYFNNLTKVKFENNNIFEDQFNVDESADYQDSINNDLTNYSDISDGSQIVYADCKPNTDRINSKISKNYTHDRIDSNSKGKEIISYICNICSQSFQVHHLYVKHLLSHSQSQTLNITEIPNMAKDITTDNDKSLKCDICSERFKSINSLSAHKRKHIPKGRVLACSICKKVFKKISPLKRHESSHESNRPYKCSVCSKSFATESTLTEHLNKHNGVKSHICPICSKAFAHLSTLTNHVKVHTKPKPYLCPTCGKRFDSSTNLNQHMRRHIGLKPFACDFCPKKFVSKGELKSHIVTHTGEKLFSCDQCNSSFTKRCSLVKHKRVHLGIKPYHCDTCPMKFTCKDHLKRHIRIHTGERPYKCDLCERAFTQSNDLVKHKRSHLGNNIYPCTECTQSFKFRTELRQHLSDHFISAQSKTLKVDAGNNIAPLNKESAVNMGSEEKG
ncbi:unnamed protein product [Chrysodeixis includens]|uniref:C2H2-type domain-containing protein n=1 Tax=Chrysodeixis includens TaxID=689277 RepID=A0A9P0G000_CHRIL|nr:unnamed protein product [Chrysodeixis includens]